MNRSGLRVLLPAILAVSVLWRHLSRLYAADVVSR
jgi:hypothetical protein